MRIYCIAFALIIVLASDLSCQSTLNVPSAIFPTIQSAINGALPGDIIVVAAGTFVENLVFPAIDFHLMGAGPGQTIIDGNQSGSCMNFSQPVSNAMIVEGFTLTNGSGDMVILSAQNPTPAGGGILIHQILGSAAPLIEPIIRNCEIVNNDASLGSGIFLRFAGDVKFENCQVHLNPPAASGSLSSGAILSQWSVGLSMVDCVIEDYTSIGAVGTINMDGTALTLSGCTVRNNTTQAYSSLYFQTSIPSQALVIENCLFDGNTTLNPNAGTIWSSSNSVVRMENCLITRNTGGVLLMTFNGSNTSSVRNCTITDNTLDSGVAGIVTAVSLGLNIENSLVTNNFDTTGAVVRGRFPQFGTPYVALNSIVETPGNTGSIVRPVFADPQLGDYHLLPMSVGVNGGTSVGLSSPLASIDKDGNPRVQFGTVDMGCYEAGHISYHHSARGRVGENFGGPFDVLQINSSSGNSKRTVTIPLGTSSNLSMIQPPNVSNPAGFAIFGLIGEATEQTITNVPLGIGDMTFPPCPVLPTHPALFTLTNNLGTFCPQLVSSTPTSWTSAPFPPIFFPLTLTFQGVIEESPGVYVPTNMVIYETK